MMEIVKFLFSADHLISLWIVWIIFWLNFSFLFLLLD